MGWVGVTPKKNVAYFFVQDGLLDHDFWREKNTGRIGAGFFDKFGHRKTFAT